MKILHLIGTWWEHNSIN